jgi:DGC domain
MKSNNSFTLEITETENTCPVGEAVGTGNLQGGKIPVLSCEGGCVRGEIARLAAHLVAQEEPFRRGCHGELFTVPNSAIAQWIRKSGKVVLIDGCFLRCHGRVLENLLGKDNFIQFDALSFYRKYTDRFDIDSVPEEERKETARLVADKVLAEMKGIFGK